MKKNQCKCKICTRSKRFFKITAKLSGDDKEFMNTCLSELDHAENDAEYWKMVAQGVWPSCRKHGALFYQRSKFFDEFRNQSLNADERLQDSPSSG